MTIFQYHPDIIARFPDLVGGIVVAHGIANGPTPDSVRELYLSEQQDVLDRIGDTPLSEIESLAAWRSAFRAFDVNPTKYRSAAEALLRRLTKKGDIPSINTLVDLCNLVSIRYALPVAALDTAGIDGAITVHFAGGSERFMNLGEDEAEHPEPGEVVFTDESGAVVARRWCWRQSDQSAARSETTDVVITIESQHPGGRADVAAAAADLCDLLVEYLGAGAEVAILGADCLAV
jgi:DNA/RNA-binding domain of Phe-tRNA-synthetase-like protein